jgi:hypothetical protein
MSHPVAVVQEFFQKAAQIPPSQLVYEFTQYCIDLPTPEKQFVCSLKTPRCELQGGYISKNCPEPVCTCIMSKPAVLQQPKSQGSSATAWTEQ